MNKITTEEIIKMVNEISEDNNSAIKQYLDLFFTKYIDIDYLSDLKINGEEHQKIEAALTGLVKVSTVTSVDMVLQILERLGIIKNESIS